MSDSPLQVAARLIAGAKRVVALTGAGISVPSGIPDFRSPEGLWTRFDIHEYGTIEAFRANPRKVWRLFHEIEAVVEGAAPNPGHVAMAELEQRGYLRGVVTQNIDRLHQRAGTQRIIEFHGSGDTFHCLACARRYVRADALARMDVKRIPLCECGAVLKPAIVLFGESIPQGALAESLALVAQSDVILVVGTSATVAPASMLPGRVQASGGSIVEMNVGGTDLSRHADVVVAGDVSVTLPELVDAIDQCGKM
jgi:NAD-dependent deacetylase